MRIPAPVALISALLLATAASADSRPDAIRVLSPRDGQTIRAYQPVRVTASGQPGQGHVVATVWKLGWDVSASVKLPGIFIWSCELEETMPRDRNNPYAGLCGRLDRGDYRLVVESGDGLTQVDVTHFRVK